MLVPFKPFNTEGVFDTAVQINSLYLLFEPY